MTVAEATPDLEQVDRNDRAFLGHPKGLGYLGFTEACERFSYYSMQTLLTLYMVNYLLLAGHIEKVTGLAWLRGWHYQGLEGQPLSSAIFGDYTSLVYLMPILGGIIADKLTGRRIALIAGALVMALGHFLMVLGLIIYLSGQRWLPADLAVADRDRTQLIGRVVAGAIGIAALVVGWLLVSGILFSSWVVGTISTIVLVAALYFYLTRNLERE